MKKRLVILLPLLINTLFLPATRAQQPAEGTPAWQVLQYDITVNAAGAGGAPHGQRSLERRLARLDGEGHSLRLRADAQRAALLRHRQVGDRRRRRRRARRKRAVTSGRE